MSVRRILAVVVGILVVAGLTWWWSTAESRSRAKTNSIRRAATPSRSSEPFESTANLSAAARRDDDSHLADQLNAPSGNIRTDLEIVAALIESFRTNFPASGNPVGENAEITAALTGRNALHVALIPRKHPAINAQGELCDRWGTPFFFHQMSGTSLEIRSAGPDRRMRTEDDVVLTP
ncbi:MAG: hypothetical protein ABIZ04_19265 [Opitutus sp.]